MALPGAIPFMSRSSLSPARTVPWSAPVPHRLRWRWPCGWRRGKYLPTQSPSEQHSAAALDALNEAFLAE